MLTKPLSRNVESCSLSYICSSTEIIWINRHLVEALTAIFCSVHQTLLIHFPRRTFDQRIDLKWFGDIKTEFPRSKSQKTVF